MVSRAAIDEFLAQKSLALVGVSRDGRGFGNVVRKELPGRGYTIRLVHPEADTIEGQPCARRLADVAGDVGGVVLVTPPAATERLVREAAEAGLRRVWMQQGAESPEALRLCQELGLAAVHGECILMFSGRPGFPHGLHLWFRKVLGRMPR